MCFELCTRDLSIIIGNPFYGILLCFQNCFIHCDESASTKRDPIEIGFLCIDVYKISNVFDCCIFNKLSIMINV